MNKIRVAEYCGELFVIVGYGCNQDGEEIFELVPLRYLPNLAQARLVPWTISLQASLVVEVDDKDLLRMLRILYG